MSKPYIYWDVAWNADLITRSASGPLIASMPDSPTPAQVELFEKLFSIVVSPRNFDDPNEHFLQWMEIAGGVAPKTGLKTYQNGLYPNGLSFSAPAPDPYDVSIPWFGHQYNYANLGYRIAMRGYAATVSQGFLGGELRVKWSDDVIRSSSDSRGAWTGLVLDFLNLHDGRTDHVVDVLHGKRPADVDWQYHGGLLDRAGPDVIDEDTATLNGITSGEARIIISPSPPDWNVTIQYFDGSWIDVHSFTIDFRSHMSGEPEEMGLVANLFAGVGDFSFDQQTFFSEVQVGQFEPWIADRSDWNWREWNLFWTELGLDSLVLYDSVLKRPKTDLIHVPEGTARGPVELRFSDPDLGICMKVGPQTNLTAYGNADDRYVELAPVIVEQLCVSDAEHYGLDAPFAFYMRGRFDAISAWGEVRNIVSFGDIHEASPTVSNNGIGLFWDTLGGDSGEFTARVYVTGGWFDLSFFASDANEWSDQPIDIGFAWTGVRGISIGRPNYELRIVINGVTRIAAIVPDFALNDSTTVAYVGGMDSADGFQGLVRGVAIYGDAITDDALGRSFDDVGLNFLNPSFETAHPSNRPGEAANWIWESVGNAYEWAEFNGYDEDLEEWRTALEQFGQGWANLRFWISDLGDEGVVLITALFNAGITAYETFIELFALWGKEWPSMTWFGTPWRDDFVYLQPFEDTVGANNGPTGFDSWFDHLFGTNLLAMEYEEFEQAWGNDPFSTAPGASWHPGTGWDARIHGHAIEFPLKIEIDKRLLVIWTDLFDIVQLNLDVGTYDTPSALVTMLNTKLQVNVPASSLVVFDYWDDGVETGLLFGYKPSTWVYSAFASMFGNRGNQISNDARPALGLDSFGPDGVTTKLPVKAWMFDVAPPVQDDEELFFFDTYSLLEFSITTDILFGTYPLVYGEEPAIFDTGWRDVPAHAERFYLDGWFGVGAVWKSDLDTPEYALFDSGTVDLEEFDPAEWPEEIWV